jgi:hypothetical protein
MPDLHPLVSHYVDTVALIEDLVLRRTPRLFRPAGLTATEREQIAHRLAQAHLLASHVERGAA